MDGEEALEKIKSENPDVIFLDLIMPKKTGFEVLEEINKSGLTAKVPVIVLSNLGQASDLD